MQSKALTKLFCNSSQKLLQNQNRTFALNKNILTRSKSVDPEIMFLSRTKFFSSLPRSSSLVRPDAVTSPCFITATKRVQLNNEAITSKLINEDVFPQTPAKFFTHRAEEEQVEVEGLGWAGQPIVKRQHTILPEVHGDTHDVLQATRKSKAISEVGNDLEVRVRHFGRSQDIIAVMNESAKNGITENQNFNKKTGRMLHKKKPKTYSQYYDFSMTNPLKQKKKKRTVVLVTKPAIMKSSIGNKKHKKKLSKTKNTIISKKGFKLQPNLASNRLFSTVPSLRYDLFPIVNRQFKTFSALGYAKAAVSVKVEKKVSKLTVTGQSKRGKASKIANVPKLSADDCVCPEILYTKGKRKATKICGEAAGARKDKKKSSWKQKMCLVEPKDDPGRKKTLVCVSEAAKLGKKKKELPKCPEPEKKVAPRVVICEPILEDEKALKSKKECVKVEEVKIRKRTKVCKPVIIFAKEEVGIKVEKKAVCSSTRVTKVVSRHTKICPPTDKKSDKKSNKSQKK